MFTQDLVGKLAVISFLAPASAVEILARIILSSVRKFTFVTFVAVFCQEEFAQVVRVKDNLLLLRSVCCCCQFLAGVSLIGTTINLRKWHIILLISLDHLLWLIYLYFCCNILIGSFLLISFLYA
jgi:hypothetical protein